MPSAPASSADFDLWEEGQEIEGGDLLGRVASKAMDDGLGSTVYIELRHGEKPVDPSAYLKRSRRVE